MRAYLAIPAGGQGLRMGGGVPKQFRDWNGKPLLRATAEAFFTRGMPAFAGLAFAVPEDRVDEVRSWPFPVPVFITVGGTTRQASVAAALAALPDEPDAAVLIHDGVRPFPPVDPIHAALDALETWDGAVLAEPCTDTLKRVDARLQILATEPREQFYRAQTPQVARLATWRDAFAAAQREGFIGTDDVQLLERLGLKIKVVPSTSANLKVTTPEDWARL